MKTKVVVISDDPQAHTGFGTVVRQVFGKMQKEHSDSVELLSIACYPCTGVAPRVIPTVKTMDQVNEDQNGAITFMQLVNNGQQPHIVFLLGDWWYWSKTLLNRQWRQQNGVVSKVWYYVPLDGTPYCGNIIQALKGADKLIAMSPFGYNILKDVHPDVAFIPHGYDAPTCKYTPRRSGKFVYGVISRNARRKNIWAILNAYSQIHNNMDTSMIIHTPTYDPIGGDLKQYARYCEIPESKLKFTESLVPDGASFKGISDQELKDLVYDKMHCMVSAGREGFGLTYLSAVAQGIRLILPEYSAHYSMNYPGAITYPVKYLRPEPHTEILDMQVDSEALRMAMIEAYNRRNEVIKPELEQLTWDVISDSFFELIKKEKEHVTDLILDRKEYKKDREKKGIIKNSMLVTMPRSTGDVLLMTGVISGLRKKYPKHKITFATERKNFHIVEGFKDIDYVIEFDEVIHNDFHWLHRVYDVAFTPHFKTQKAANWVHGGKGLSLAETYAKECNVDIGEYYFKQQEVTGLPESYITLHAGSGAGEQEARFYTHWQEVIKGLDVPVILVGTHVDRPILGATDWRGKLSTTELAYVLKNAKLHVGIDSFPMHLSAIVGTKSVILWGNTFHNITGPEKKLQHLMTPIEGTRLSDDECQRPCHRTNCKCCYTVLNRIKPQEIITTIKNILK